MELELLGETAKWKSREVRYVSGGWSQILENIPEFELGNFSDNNSEIVNQYYKTVIRLPLTPIENKVPIGIVSNSYTLAQHREVAELCIQGIAGWDIDVGNLRCELGLSTLGEWMNFRIYFPDEYDFKAADGEPLKLRLECFNSVDGSSRLTILFGWYRFVCSNGMIIGKTVSELRDIHNQHMDLRKIKNMVSKAMQEINDDKEQMLTWESTRVESSLVADWVDSAVTRCWGKLAAFRVFHICSSGRDAKYMDKFESEKPSRKSKLELERVEGSPSRAETLYDVGQALSWVATNRKSAEERTKWQIQIPRLLENLADSAHQHHG